MSYPVENALFQWEEGWRRLEERSADPAADRRARRVVAAVQDELRRRIGPTFAVGELAELYAAGTDWCLEVALDSGSVADLDPHELADAAFWLYLRGARDYSSSAASSPVLASAPVSASPPGSASAPPTRRMTS